RLTLNSSGSRRSGTSGATSCGTTYRSSPISWVQNPGPAPGLGSTVTVLVPSAAVATRTVSPVMRVTSWAAVPSPAASVTHPGAPAAGAAPPGSAVAGTPSARGG